jgi:hypothetical protein
MPADPDVDPALLAAIGSIRAIDDHAHPLKLTADGEEDGDWDALSYDEVGKDFVATIPERIRWALRAGSGSAEYVDAWRSLWKYPFDDASDEHVKWLLAAKARAKSEHGDAYSAWVLDQIGIETMIANRVAMGRGLVAPRFRWAVYVDALMLPLDVDSLRKRSPDTSGFLPGVVKDFHRLLGELHLDAPPPKLADYMRLVVTPTLERLKAGGALAVKFEAAYLRSLQFADPAESEATRVYERWARGGTPPATDYTLLQDYLLRRIAAEAGRLGLAVHFHVAFGPGAYFRVGESGPLALEPVFTDPKLQATKFVMVHGGWPDTNQAMVLTAKPNVWADFSWQTLIRYPRALAATLRAWIEFKPDKLLFGTDAFDGRPGGGWEENTWLATETARRALAIALTGMVRDREVTRERALELARMVLHDNASSLYGLGSRSE